MKWHQSKTIDLNVKTNMDAWRQRLLSEGKSQADITQKEIERLQEQLESKNSYFGLMKTDMARTRKEEADKKAEETKYGYDKVFAHYDEKIAGSTKYEDRKVARKPAKQGPVREDMQAVTTTSQQVGWREPYDNMLGTHNRTGMCKRTFMDCGHL